ncbi:hypothetical protein [Rhodoferax saidenbachensis]|uniref:DUF5666 domain-containing protein n=1 Tax=Rhodoferax saidenbachensis TaxID=1484693 RepID=A0A1P8K7Y4_9BURK|nr:hypothetical protein [Rhodoferax saidenbachensis]APW42130.1 hypothetical protein RS694_06000 [Rhodoferax saidenbachensis]
MMTRLHAALLSILYCAASAAWAQAPATVRMRGTVQSVSASTLTVKDRSGEVVELLLPAALVVTEVYPIALADIQPGSFIGTAALPQADGSQRAIAVTVFPESARGAGEGHRPFDLLPQSTMTNATVAEVSAAANGRRLQLKYKDGAMLIVVPEDAPVVTFRPGDRSLLVPGASVSLSAQLVDGKPTVQRINAGKNGFKLPY